MHLPILSMQPKYITCNFQGRLGNLMYEIAATLAAAWRNDATPVFPSRAHDYYRNLPAFEQYISPLLEQFYQYNSRRMKFTEYHEPADYHYEEIKADNNLILHGYFTTSMHWDEYRDKIIDLFSTNQEYVNTLAENIISKYPGREFVSVHVRRTDYVTDYQWDLPLSYYEQAAAQFENPIFVIFSDDPDWCKENLSFLKEKVFITDKDYLELLLMGKFHAHIIANSTFSAWGAMLGDRNRAKKVIAPKVWSPVKHNQNIQEKHWILI